jgi:hypothetical protein
MATRTVRRKVEFASPFTLKPIDGVLPSGSYDVEVDEEELIGMHNSGFVRVATLFTVERGGMSRVYTVQAADLDAALVRDGQPALLR